MFTFSIQMNYKELAAAGLMIIGTIWFCCKERSKNEQ